MLKPITLQVEAPIAEAYQNTTPENLQALQTLVSIFLQKSTRYAKSSAL